MAIGALRLLSTLWRALCGLRLLLLALEARHNVVNAQNHDGRLDGCLDCLNLDGHWLPDAKVLHVRKHALVAINTPRDVACRRMLCPECGESANDVCTTVLDESAGDNLECRSHGLVGPLPNALDALGLFEEQLRQRHLSCAATGNEARVHQHIARDVHGILQVAFNLHEDVLARTTEENRACLGILALSDEGKVLITNLLHLEKARASANVRLLQLVRAVHNRRTARPANAVVVRLAHSPQSSDVMLHKVVLCKVGNTLLRDDKVGLECDDVVAHLLNKFLFELQNVLPVAFLCHLEVRLALALLILQGAIQQHDARVFNAATHLSVRHILVDHHTSKHLRLLNLTAGNLLNLGVALNVDFAAPILLNGDGAHGRKCDLAGEVGPPLHELGTETRLDNVEHSRVVIRVDGRADVLFNEGGCIIQSLGVRTDNDGGVHLALEEGLRDGEHLAGKNDNRRGSVADLLVLCPADLNHRLCGRVRHVNLAQDGISVVCHDNATHRIHEHFEHGARAKASANDIRNSPRRRNVAQLDLTAALSLDRLVEDDDWLLHFRNRCVFTSRRENV
eukprot:Opistho-2@80702